MGVWDRLRESFNPPVAEVATLREQVRQETWTNELLTERLAELELAIEDQNWTRLTGEAENDFSRAGLRRITQMARIYWIKNPLIKRAVAIQQTYVFGQGINIQAREPEVNAVIQAFLEDPANQVELTSHQALTTKEAELQVDANLFFTFFVNPLTGAVRVRSLPFAEVEDIITNPDDAKEPWYYLRRRMVRRFNTATGGFDTGTETTYHPDWRYKPTTGKPNLINGARVRWDAPVYHVAVNKLSDMRFGVSEVYAAIDWAKAYKDFLQDWATIVRAYSRFAWQMTTKGGKAGVTAAKTRLGNTIGTGLPDTNPAPAAGSAFVATEGTKMEPIKTAGATTSAEDGRRLLLMVCAALGIPEHYFGDPSTGNLATSTTMERPVELKFLDRRKLWSDVLGAILNFVIDANVRAAAGKLDGTVALDDYGVERVTLAPDPDPEPGEDPNEPMDRHVDITFPALLDHDISQRVNAIVAATTFNGGTPLVEDMLPIAVRMCLVELGAEDVDAQMEKLFPPDWKEQRADKAAEKIATAQAAFAGAKQVQGEDGVAEAARDLREAVREMLERAA